MSQFAVLHVQKLKNIGGFESHIRRAHLPARSAPERVHLNEVIFRQSGSLEEAIERRIREGHTIKNKDGRTEKIHVRAVRAGSLMLTGSHERMHEIYNNKELWARWKQANFEFVKRELGEENIIDMGVHIDEKTPHIHCVFVPISKDNRLSYDSFFGNKLVGWQNRYWQSMKEFGFERGVSKEITGKVHQDTLEWEKKQISALKASQKEAEKVTEEIKPSNVLKLGEVREKQKNVVANLIRKSENLERDNKELGKRILNIQEQSKKAAYEQSLREEMDERLDWIKRNIEIGPFLKDRGWKELKEKSNERAEVLIHPRSGEKIIVPVAAKANGQRVFSYPGGGEGTLITLLRENHWDLEDILEIAEGIPVTSLQKHPRIEESPISKSTVKREEARKEAEKYLDKIVRERGKDFLASREIEKRTHTGFEGVRVSAQAAVFAMYKDFDKEGNADLCSTVTYKRDKEGKGERWFQKGLSRGLSMMVGLDHKLSDAGRIVVTKSPIDALSYRQLELTSRLHKDGREGEASTAFLSTCAGLSPQIKDDLRMVFEMAREKEQIIVLAMEKDLAGRKMGEELVHIAEDVGCRWEVETPTIGKDWNDELLATKGKEIEDVQEIISETTWNLFKDSSFEVSILPRIAIEKETLEAFSGNVKAGEWGMIVSLREMGKEGISSTWLLEIDENNKFRIIGEEAVEVSILKGNPKIASELVLVTSPMDALVHYQSLETKGDICYVMVNPAKLELPTLEVVGRENFKHVAVVSGEKNTEDGKVIHDFLKAEKKEVVHVHLDLTALRNKAAENLGIGKETVEAFKKKVTVELKEEAAGIIKLDFPQKPQEVGKEVNEPRERGEVPKARLDALAEKTGAKQSAFSVIYGDMKAAEKLVLVVSRNDAMLHYEKEKATGGEIPKTCYVLCDITSRENLKESAKKLREEAKKREMDIQITSSKENMSGARSVRYAFGEESMRVSLERLKREVPLAAFLEKEMGWKRLEERSSKENDVLTNPKDGENIVIPKHPKENGHRVFSYEKGGGGGTIIDLLMEAKWDWKEVAKLAEKKFLPQIEEAASPRISQKVESNIEVAARGIASIADAGFDLLDSIMSAGLSANNSHQEDDEKNRKKKEEQEQAQRRGRTMRM